MRPNPLLLQAAIAFAPIHAQPAQAKPAHAIRAQAATTAPSSSPLTLATSFTSLAKRHHLGRAVVETGEFTAADGGVYGVTVSNGYAVVDGKTLAPGQEALIGNEIVSEGRSGIVANGQTLVLSTVSLTPTASTTTAAGSGSSAGSAMTSSTGSGVASAASSGSSSSSQAAAAPAMATGYGGLAAAGGLIALFAL
ncbi:hypothetical protein Tdes44962_MAKER10075 [Teratosphaeria destructans]|uniref:Uncharacterized protein n=1 Tax=Teratosphaeria destructans TaxID=418781 RepID=A0A9W7SPD1_9PEZI|nr:hypothetical protein Tdes44962_MAKER10075 [Teratosphaeria destructans]